MRRVVGSPPLLTLSSISFWMNRFNFGNGVTNDFCFRESMGFVCFSFKGELSAPIALSLCYSDVKEDVNEKEATANND